MKVEGLEKIKNKLEELDNKLQRSIIRKGMRVGAKEWKTEAQAQAPKDTGLTASKIKVRSGGSKKGVTRISVGVDEKDFTGEAFYAAFNLFGHHIGKRALGESRKLVPANNWLERAFNSAKQSVVDTTEASWEEQIEDATQ